MEFHVRQIFTKLGLVPQAEDHRRVLAVLTYLRHPGDQRASAAVHVRL
ncbi:MAG: hypothetical protein ACR2LJ_14350 [Acidimicrobiales bacterium]